MGLEWGGEYSQPAENFHLFRSLLSLANFYPVNCFNDNMEPMAIVTAWTKIYSTKYFHNVRLTGLYKKFVQQKFSAVHGNYRYMETWSSNMRYLVPSTCAGTP